MKDFLSLSILFFLSFIHLIISHTSISIFFKSQFLKNARYMLQKVDSEHEHNKMKKKWRHVKSN